MLLSLMCAVAVDVSIVFLLIVVFIIELAIAECEHADVIVDVAVVVAIGIGICECVDKDERERVTVVVGVADECGVVWPYLLESGDTGDGVVAADAAETIRTEFEGDIVAERRRRIARDAGGEATPS
jgi:hypothetical protein